MEHIANVTGKDPISVRLANMSKTDNTIVSLIDDLKSISDYTNRVKQVEDFNQVTNQL